MSVVAVRRRHIAQIGHKIPVALPAVMLRISDGQFHRSSGHQIAHIMQVTLVHLLPFGHLSAERAGSLARIAVFLDDPGFGQILHPQVDAFRLILARTEFRRWFCGCLRCFHSASVL
jgi:hypothetical protein